MTSAELAFEQIQSFFAARGLACRMHEDERVIEIDFRDDTGVFRAFVRVRQLPAIAGVFVRMPLIVPEGRRREAAETIVRVNFALLLGRFDLDFSNGELAFYASLPLADTGLTEDQLDALLEASMWAATRYLRAFNRLLYADDLSPAEVIAEVEMAEEPRE